MRRSQSSQPGRSRHQPRRQTAQDIYGLQAKLADPTACPSCGAIYRAGRWSWGSAPVEAERVECPACRRIADKYPAGILSIRGEFAAAHRA